MWEIPQSLEEEKQYFFFAQNSQFFSSFFIFYPLYLLKEYKTDCVLFFYIIKILGRRGGG